jgi:UDP-N-acetyl-D-glucosamine dehydrogenase
LRYSESQPAGRRSDADAAVLDGFLEKIESRTAVVAIVGLGYVGLPLAQIFANQGYRVIGFDLDEDKVDKLNRGETYIRHIPSETLQELCRDGRFQATSDPARLGEADAVLLCVPTPLTRHREPDITAVEASTRMLVPHTKPGQLIVLESTTYPGTTAEVMTGILQTSGLEIGTELFVAYSPEREDPGNPSFTTSSIPKVVGGDDPASRRAAEALYGAVVREVVAVSGTRTAEAIKLTENIFRSVNIALVNELKLIYGGMGIDVWEVIDAAKTKPFGFMPFYPGPGLGGHCIPIDPFYLTWKAREYETPTRFIELAGEVNTSMPHHVVSELAEALDRRLGVALSRARVLMVGLAYKKNVDDIRESPSLRLIELLQDRGATLSYHDPYVPKIPRTREHAELAGWQSVPIDEETLAGVDAVLICTDHDDVDYARIQRGAPLVVDTRNVMQRTGATGDNVVKA